MATGMSLETIVSLGSLSKLTDSYKNRSRQVNPRLSPRCVAPVDDSICCIFN